MPKEQFYLVDKAVGGDEQALEELLLGVQDMVFNLSLRMLGSPHDAEDASQEIYVRVITSLSTFKKESAFSTWVYRVACNHLLNYKKSMFAKMPPLSFEYYGADIDAGHVAAGGARAVGVDEDLLAQELKMSCTNVMLQCFDSESRLIYVLGTMLKVDSKICGEILGITPEAYRQRLSRARHKMAGFLSEYCGLASSPRCGCKQRVGYAIQNRRLDPANLEYTKLAQAEASAFIQAMEEIDSQSHIFANLPRYRSPQKVQDYLQKILHSEDMETILSGEVQ
ncbi:MAG TPA: RNA polymerase subunit sigma-24 [Clostridiales bacterium]|nr:RNA polymerase subunit sigma-24 [Clostridiales bacterium]